MACSGGLAVFDPTKYDEHILRARRFADAAAAAGTSGLNAAIAAMNWASYRTAMNTAVAGTAKENWDNVGRGGLAQYTDFRNPPATLCYPHSEASLYALVPIYQAFHAFYVYPSPSGSDITASAPPTGDYQIQRVLFAGWWGARRWGMPNWATVALQFYAPWESVISFASIQ